jgi:hypothetical protein
MLGFPVVFCRSHNNIYPLKFFMPWLIRGYAHTHYDRDAFLWYRIKMFVRIMFLELQPAITNVGKIVKTYFDRIRFPKKKKKMCVVCYENKRPVKINCKHNLCVSCLNNIVYINSNYAFKCPMCSTILLGEISTES